MEDKTLQIGDKVVRIHTFETFGNQLVPVVKVDAEEIKHPDGRVDVIIKVPCLSLDQKQPNSGW